MATPDYIKKAHNNYNAKFDLIQVKLPKGTKERIKEITDMSYNEYVKSVVLVDLDRLEREEKTVQESIQNAQITPENPEVKKITEPEQKPLKTANKDVKTEQEKQKELQDIYQKKSAAMDAWRQKEANKKEQEKEQRKRDVMDIVDSMRAATDEKREKDREKYRQFTESDIEELLAGDGLEYFLNPENPGTLFNMIGAENFKRLQDAARQRINAKNLEGLSS